MQAAPDEVVHSHPGQQAEDPDGEESGPGRRLDVEGALEERVVGGAEGEVKGAENGFGAGLNKRG